MGWLAPAVPWIVKGGSMIGGALLGRKAQNSAMKRTPEEMAALTGAQQGATQLGQAGTSLFDQSQQTLAGPTSYYSALLGGDRAKMALATAGPRASITDNYRGAERGLERSGVRGAVGDLAKAELSRDRAGQIASLTAGVQPGAAGALTNIGTSQEETGLRATDSASSIWRALLGEGAANREYGRQEGEKFGTSMGGLLFDILNGSLGKMKFGKKPIGGMPDQGVY